MATDAEIRAAAEAAQGWTWGPTGITPAEGFGIHAGVPVVREYLGLVDPATVLELLDRLTGARCNRCGWSCILCHAEQKR